MTETATSSDLAPLSVFLRTHAEECPRGRVTDVGEKETIWRGEDMLKG